MDKQERERLRQDCNNFIGSQSYYYPSEAKDMIALLDHIDALEGKVKAAFDEGYEFGLNDGCRDLITGPEPCWNRSNTKAVLTQAEEKGK